MTRALDLLSRYRWELTPLVTMAIVEGVLAPLAGSTSRGALSFWWRWQLCCPLSAARDVILSWLCSC